METLEVSPQEFSDIRDWTLLPEPEYLSRMYAHDPALKKLVPGECVQLVVLWQWAHNFRPYNALHRRTDWLDPLSRRADAIQ